MKIGLVGAQRVGKSTLAKAFAEASGIKFIPTTTTSVLESLGMDPKIHYPVEQRLYAQQIILDKLEIQWEANDNCIFDRTPLDVLAYMEADVLRTFPDGQVSEQYMAYRTRCWAIAQRFNHIVLVQPGIALIDEPGKAPANRPYMEHFNSLVFGYLAELSMGDKVRISIMYRNVLDLNQRVEFLTQCLK